MVIVILQWLSSSCTPKPQQQMASDLDDTFYQAKEALGANALCEANSDSTFILCQKQEVPTQIPMGNVEGNAAANKAYQKVTYFIWDVAEKQVARSEVINYGMVQWRSKHQLLIEEGLGVEGSPKQTVFDPVTKKLSVPKSTTPNKP